MNKTLNFLAFIESNRNIRVKEFKMKPLNRIFLYLLPIPIGLSVVIFLYLNRPAEPDRTEIDLYLRAVNAYHNADFELCLSISSALIEGNSSFHQAGLLKAKAEYFSGNYAAAAQTLEEVQKKKENYYEAELWLIRSLIQIDELDKAVALGEDLLSRAPEDPRILGALASAALILNDFRAAIEYRKRASLFEEELALNRIELAKIYSGILNPETALQQLKRALELLSPHSPLRRAVTELIEQTELQL